MKRYPGLTLRVLADGHAAMGPGKARLLEAIAQAGSISAAAREMGMSYRRAWMLVEEVNASFAEPLVVAAAGGKRGGGAEVTAAGLDIVRRFLDMEAKASAAIAPDLRRFEKLVRRKAR